MPSLQQAQTALDVRMDQTFPEFGARLLKGNQDNVTVSKGTVPYLRFRVTFSEDNQMQLGRRDDSSPCPRRVKGYILLFIHTRFGTGDGARNELQSRFNQAFASRLIGGVTMQNARVVSAINTENWAITGIQVPFYFDTQGT